MSCIKYEKIDFEDVEKSAIKLAERIQHNLDEIIEILLEYESYEVATDEIARTIDLLTNLEENKQYFRYRAGNIATFLPRNQPLYAFTCFVVVPSLQSKSVHFRIPHSMRDMMPKLFAVLDTTNQFSNIIISPKERLSFLKERSALLLNPENKQTILSTDLVIYTGSPKHAEQLRLVFDNRTVFITNGSGHNPLIVGAAADIEAAVNATLKLTLYNQGQDCAAPNSILVHHTLHRKFINQLHKDLEQIKIGRYRDRESKVGPISNYKDILRIQKVLVENQPWIDPQTPGNINTAESIVEPTIINKPLKEGGNYEESFAPIIFIQKFESDTELATYFENDRYYKNMMYITLYGENTYIKDLLNKEVDGKTIHDDDTFLHNTHLHAAGIERGTQPYGGYGVDASNYSHYGKIEAQPTLPQREIHELLIAPHIKDGVFEPPETTPEKFTELKYRKVEKILRLHQTYGADTQTEKQVSQTVFIDTQNIAGNERFLHIPADELHYLLDSPNIEVIATLNPGDIENIRKLRTILEMKTEISEEEFKSKLYAIVKDPAETVEHNKKQQLHFFKSLYWLLFNKDSGPRLVPFLHTVSFDQVDKLLDM